MGTQLPPPERGTVAPSFRPMSVVATVAHLSYCWALVVAAAVAVIVTANLLFAGSTLKCCLIRNLAKFSFYRFHVDLLTVSSMWTYSLSVFIARRGAYRGYGEMANFGIFGVLHLITSCGSYRTSSSISPTYGVWGFRPTETNTQHV